MALKVQQQSERTGLHDICLFPLFAFQPSISINTHHIFKLETEPMIKLYNTTAQLYQDKILLGHYSKI